jgi:hypothetical protein
MRFLDRDDLFRGFALGNMAGGYTVLACGAIARIGLHLAESGKRRGYYPTGWGIGTPAYP